MALEGTFGDFGLADIFQLVGLQKKTGVLTVRGEGRQVVTVSFEKGMVVFADEFQRDEAERLGSVLLRTRLLTEEQIAKAVAIQKSTAQRLGFVLVDQRLITRQELAQALQLQVKETVYRLFRWAAGSYHFSPEPVAYDREIYLPIPAELVLMEGVRMIDEWPVIEKKIPTLQVIFERVPGATVPRAAPGKPVKADIEDLMAIVDDDMGPGGGSFEHGGDALGPRENAVLGLVDGLRTVQELVDLSKLGEFETCKVLYGLISLNLIRARAEGPAAAAAAPAPAARGRDGGAGREYGIIAAGALLALVAFLFNPWGVVELGFRARESRRESAALVDAVRLRRVRLALEVFRLEKQSYPPTLEKLAESGLLGPRELRETGGAPFAYRAGEREYRLEREGVK
jgi:hypothetical protein